MMSEFPGHFENEKTDEDLVGSCTAGGEQPPPPSESKPLEDQPRVDEAEKPAEQGCDEQGAGCAAEEVNIKEEPDDDAEHAGCQLRYGLHVYPAPPSEKHPNINWILESFAKVALPNLD